MSKKSKDKDDESKKSQSSEPEQTDAAEETPPNGGEPDVDNMSDEEFNDYLRNAADYSDTTAEGPETEEAAAEAAEAEATGNTPFKVFDTEADYNAAMEDYANRTYGDRIRAGDAATSRLNSLSDAASRYYDDGETDPIGRLSGDLESQTAARYNQTPEEYRQAQQDKKDLEAYRGQQAAAQEQQNGQQEIINRWNTEAERLKQNVPDFDLETAFQNEEFRNMVIGGASVDGAYYAVKYNELQQQQTPNGREPIPQNAAQSGTKPGASVNDLMSQNDGDFRKSLRNIMNN